MYCENPQSASVHLYIRIHIKCIHRQSHPLIHSLTHSHWMEKFNLYLSSVNGLSSNLAPFTFIERSRAHTHTLPFIHILYFVSKPLFIFMLYMYRFCVKWHEVYSKTSICLNCIHHHRHLSIFMQFSESKSECFSFFLYRSLFLLYRFVVTLCMCVPSIVFHIALQSNHTISIRQAFAQYSVPDLILRSVYAHVATTTYVTTFTCTTLDAMSDANNTLVKCHVCGDSVYDFFYIYFSSPGEVCPSFSASIYLFVFISSGLHFCAHVLPYHHHRRHHRLNHHTTQNCLTWECDIFGFRDDDL